MYNEFAKIIEYSEKIAEELGIEVPRNLKIASGDPFRRRLNRISATEDFLHSVMVALVPAEEEEAKQPQSEYFWPQFSSEPFDEKTVPVLREWCDDPKHKVDLTGCTRKEDILKAIKKFIEGEGK